MLTSRRELTPPPRRLRGWDSMEDDMNADKVVDQDEYPEPEPEPKKELCCDNAHYNEAGGICCKEHYGNTCGYDHS